MTDRADYADDLTLGDLLRRARERRGLSVEDVARITRIPRRHLAALECGHLDELPGGMYRRAEVRTYAETVGLDKAIALERLEQASGPAAAETTPASSASELFEPAPRGQVYAAMTALALLAAAVVTFWWWQTANEPAGTEAALEAALGSRPTPVAAASPSESSLDGDTAAPTIVEPSPASPPVAGETAAAPASVERTEDAAARVDGLALAITSSPPGARVLIDGIGYGRTPITVHHLQAGERRVRLVLDGYVSAEQLLRLSRSRPASLDVTLEPQQ